MLYRKALASSVSAQERAVLLSRIGRCYFKLGEYRKAISEYKKILELESDEITIGNVLPQSLLSPDADCFEALKADKEQTNAMIELYQHLIDQPWDLAGGDYLYYLNRLVINSNYEFQLAGKVLVKIPLRI